MKKPLTRPFKSIYPESTAEKKVKRLQDLSRRFVGDYVGFLPTIRGLRRRAGSLTLLSFIFICLNLHLIVYAVPKSAVILEKRNVAKDRQLIIWMQDPEKHPRDPGDELYTCPDETRGHYYTGAAHVSLFNSNTHKLINEIAIRGNGVTSEDDLLDLPYLIHRGYYDVPKIDVNNEGKPVLMKLKDYNDDGNAYEFALFDAVACMGLETTLIGFSAAQDKVIQYQTELKAPDGTVRKYWVDYFFSQLPVKKMFWKYEIDYRGRGGYLDKYEIRYDSSKEMFFGSVRYEEDKPEDSSSAF